MTDAYPDAVPGAPPARLQAIERLCLDYRWKLRGASTACAACTAISTLQHPVSTRSTQPTLLDASRGCLGEPADDLTALAVNYVFFALEIAPRGGGVLAPVASAVLHYSSCATTPAPGGGAAVAGVARPGGVEPALLPGAARRGARRAPVAGRAGPRARPPGLDLPDEALARRGAADEAVHAP